MSVTRRGYVGEAGHLSCVVDLARLRVPPAEGRNFRYLVRRRRDRRHRDDSVLGAVHGTFAVGHGQFDLEATGLRVRMQGGNASGGRTVAEIPPIAGDGTVRVMRAGAVDCNRERHHALRGRSGEGGCRNQIRRRTVTAAAPSSSSAAGSRTTLAVASIATRPIEFVDFICGPPCPEPGRTEVRRPPSATDAPAQLSGAVAFHKICCRNRPTRDIRTCGSPRLNHGSHLRRGSASGIENSRRSLTVKYPASREARNMP